jgi:cold-inducible RNA-binding protein
MSVRLFVGNLSYEVTEADLREYFSTLAPVSYVSIPVDRETGKRRGFAFVELGEPAQAEEAIRRFNNQMFKGRPIAVNEARARESRPPGGSFPRSTSSYPSIPPADSLDPISRGERRNRRFGPDAKPVRNRNVHKGKAKTTEIKRKGPIPEKRGGRLYGTVDDFDEEYDSPEVDEFAQTDEIDQES